MNTGEEVATANIVAETGGPMLSCTHCKKDVPQDGAALVAKAKSDLATTPCPTCKRVPSPGAQAVGCRHCGRSVHISSALAGRSTYCPWCSQQLSIPAETEQPALKQSAEAFQWLVFRRDSLLRQFENKGELIAAIQGNKVGPFDVCMVHQAAEPTSLRQACDKEISLRKLYNPTGATAVQIGTGAFAVCAALYLMVDFYWFGWRQSLILLTAIASVTILQGKFWIGFIALWILGGLLGVPVGGGTFITLLVEALSAALAGAVGGGIAYGATYLTGTVAGWNKRAVVWHG